MELSLLQALWEACDSPEAGLSTRELHDKVGAPRGIVYTTVAKVLDRMNEKRMVERVRSGRSYRYRASIARTDTQRSMLRRLLSQLVGAEAQPAMAALAGALEDVSPALLEQLAQEIAKRRGGDDGA